MEKRKHELDKIPKSIRVLYQMRISEDCETLNINHPCYINIDLYDTLSVKISKTLVVISTHKLIVRLKYKHNCEMHITVI